MTDSMDTYVMTQHSLMDSMDTHVMTPKHMHDLGSWHRNSHSSKVSRQTAVVPIVPAAVPNSTTSVANIPSSSCKETRWWVPR